MMTLGDSNTEAHTRWIDHSKPMSDDQKLRHLEWYYRDDKGATIAGISVHDILNLARIGAAVQSLRTSAIYYEGALGVKLVPSESGEPLLHMIADSLSALPQVKP